MGLYADIVDHDEMLANEPPGYVFANDFNTSNELEKEKFEQHLYSHHKHTEAIENSVSCDCGAITDVYKIGLMCDCGTEVVSTTNRPIRPSMWLRAPKGVSSLISPQLWIMLNAQLSTREINFLEYLTDTSYKFDYNSIASDTTRRKVDRLLAGEIPRGLNNFIDNFDQIFQFLLDRNIIDKNKQELATFVNTFKSKMFPQVIPIPTKLCFVVESTTSGVYIDKPIANAIDAALTMSSIESSVIPLKPIVVQNRTAKVLRFMASFHENYAKDRISQKPGLVRRHVLGGRLNLTARAVITSISEPHSYDELHVPWGLACQLLKYHLVNKLKKKLKLTAREAIQYVYTHVLTYDPLLDEIFKELIAESREGGLFCLFSRNPTLQRGSTQRFRITVIKTDLADTSISLSVLILKEPIIVAVSQ